MKDLVLCVVLVTLCAVYTNALKCNFGLNNDYVEMPCTNGVCVKYNIKLKGTSATIYCYSNSKFCTRDV